MSIYEKLKNKTATLGVIGLGYVGLPLAVEKAKAGFMTIGFDVQREKIDMVNSGKNYIGDVVNEDLNEIVKSGLLYATDDFSQVASADCVLICVPTPLEKNQQPHISYFKASSDSIVP
jgi:UDP-N-acetyl-D-glucosamine dehydrogenase